MALLHETMTALRQKVDAQFDDLLLSPPEVPEVLLKEALPPLSEKAQLLAEDLRLALARDCTLYAPESSPLPPSLKPVHEHSMQSGVSQQALYYNSPFFKLPFFGLEAPFPEEKTAAPTQMHVPELQPNGQGEEAGPLQPEGHTARAQEDSPPEEVLPPSATRNLVHVLTSEFTLAQKKPEGYQSSLDVVEKLPRILLQYLQGQVSPAIANLQALCDEHPNDRLAAYTAAHLYYHRAGQGQTQLLPQARQYAKKAMADNAMMASDVLYRFRYRCISVDAGFAPERLLEMLHAYQLLTPAAPIEEATQEEAALYVKAIALFAKTEAEKWADQDVRALERGLLTLLGGGFLYRTFFFEKLAPYLVRDKGGKAHMFEGIAQLHKAVCAVFAGLEEVRANRNVKTLGAVEKAEQGPFKLFWTVSQRLLAACEKTLLVPEEDAFLLNTNLTGTAFSLTPTLDQALHGQDVLIEGFWQFWAQHLLPVEGVYAAYNLPQKVAALEKPFLLQFEALLEALQEEEQTHLMPERWIHLLPYFTPYKYTDIASAGAGQMYRPSAFMPPMPSLKNCYLAWGGEGAGQTFFSELLRDRAARGGFSSLREVKLAFEGAIKLLYDTEYGLKAKQNKAWRTYLDEQHATQNPPKKNKPSLWGQILLETWWFFILIAPSGVMSFFAVVSAQQISFFLKITLLIVITVGFMLAGFYALRQVQAVQKRKPKLKTVIDPKGNVRLGP